MLSLEPSIGKRNLKTKKTKLIEKIKFISLKRFEKHPSRNKPWFKAVKQFEAQLGLLMIVGFSIIMNLSIASAKNIEDTAPINPISGLSTESITDTATTINRYLSDITITKEKLQLAMTMQTDNEYIQSVENFDTNITPEDPKPAPVAEKRTKTIDYTVQSGDTISGIAARFGLSTSTIKYSNNVANIDNLKIGQTIKIPSANLSATALAKLQNKKVALAYNRNTTARDSGDNGHYIIPVAHHGISRGILSYHKGIDYMCGVGTPVKATASGTITEADGIGWNYGYGKTIVIRHANGVTSRYGHLSRLAVSAGDSINQGEIIGYSGNTGNSTGPHLHFELHIGGRVVNP